ASTRSQRQTKPTRPPFSCGMPRSDRGERAYLHGQVMVCGGFAPLPQSLIWRFARRASQIHQLFSVSIEDGKDAVTQTVASMIVVVMKTNQDEIKAPQPVKLLIYSYFKPNRLHFSRCRAVLRTTWQPARKHAPLEKPCSLQNCRRRFAVRSAVPRKKTHNRG